MGRLLGVISFVVLSLCLPSPAAGQEQPAICGRDGKRAALEVAPGEKALVDFGRSRGRQVNEIELVATGCEFEPNSPLHGQPRQFRRGGASIPNEQVDVAGITERKSLLVKLGVDSSGLDPGAYTGKIVIDDPRVELFSFQATVQLQYDRWYLLVLAMVPVLALGTFLIWAGANEPLLPNKFRSIGKFVMAISAAGGAFYATYWKDPAWGSDGWQLITLAGVVLAAYMASVSAASGIGGALGSRNRRGV